MIRLQAIACCHTKQLHSHALSVAELALPCVRVRAAEAGSSEQGTKAGQLFTALTATVGIIGLAAAGTAVAFYKEVSPRSVSLRAQCRADRLFEWVAWMRFFSWAMQDSNL